jgi:putative endonuclease
MPETSRQRIGRRGEQLAAAFLNSAGYRIERRNVRYPVGEIDLVARDGPVLCFVEVRSASSGQWGGPLASITEPKRRRLIRAARWYLAGKPPPAEIRFDVLGITWDGETPNIELIRGAFDAT